MSAREKLFLTMAGGWSLTQAEAAPLYRAIDDFAHELAEQIRNADYPAHATDGADYAADTIDPYASAVPVRPDEEPTR